MTFKNIFLFVISFSIFTLAQNVYTTGDILSGWQSQSRNDVMIRSNANVCHRADSAAAGKNFFIPTRSPTEWSAVNTHPPTGLTITPCVCEPFAIDIPSCAIANGSGSRQCWSNGAAWGACAQTCNVGYTMTAGVCVANVTYAYYWRSFMPSPVYTQNFTSSARPAEVTWYRMYEFCDKEVIGNPWNVGNVQEPDESKCVAYDRPKNTLGCAWIDYSTQSQMINECH